MIENKYAQRKILRKIEKAWSRFEALVTRLTTPEFNPLYHLGTLSIYLLIVITVTGFYLTIFYRPGSNVAFASVERISSNWFGSLNRSIHRYASDGFLLVVLIHGLKTLLSDRFWESRWVAWVSGWLLVVFSWVIGTMGYWLVWDQRAQWMTEYLINSVGGAVALTFLGTDIAGSTFAAFVIVLFIHIFLPLSLLILMIVHVIRLARPLIWSPRWLMYLSLLALIILSFWKPAISDQPANLNHFIESTTLDGWYLGFLPLIDQIGNGWFWSTTFVVFGVATLLPWLSKGESNGPAVIYEPECTGCALCAAECPYRAIEMHYRDDDTSRFKSIAVINANLCTGCGLCVGTCATLGIELENFSVVDLYDHSLLLEVKNEIDSQDHPIVIFTCERHASLGSLPSSLNINQWTDEQSGESLPVYLGAWIQDHKEVNTITGVLPCIGMVDVEWIKELTALGVQDVLLLGCPYDDCIYREGPLWMSNRLDRRKSIIKPNLHWSDYSPSTYFPIDRMMSDAAQNEEEKSKPVFPKFNLRKKRFPKFSITGLVVLMLTFVFALALPAEFSTGSLLADQGQLRVVVEHSGKVNNYLDNSSVVLPEGASVEASQILGGERFPVKIKMEVNHNPAIEAVYEPRGLRNEGEINGVGTFDLSPGDYFVAIWIMDDDTEWRVLYSDTLQIKETQIYTFIYDQQNDIFKLITEE